ncbi:hypothetical protein MANES_11G040056v8 [Manihot esculenta]|uniref:Uncharacterized protein n=1 Tax=Manihot esculenta TaxID=3983 RepID=A0ACB7GVB4_MANES|nr:hypothetical protein MANES_11G040056v8 [Manihot esculenta]
MASRLGMNRADRRIETRDQNESGSSPEKSIGPKSYSYGELARVTGHFSLNNLIGRGGFGHVFKASLDGEIRAIKRLDFPDVQCEGGLEREIMVVKSVSHKNLVELVGYCIDGANRLLILKYFPNGSLRSKLHGSGDVLDWKKRMKIATGSAKGLEYLHEHCKPKIIHLDIKPDNILLDENFESKIADFGLAQFFTDGATHISKSSVMGTHVYEDPLTTKLGKYSDKSDIYSFGITLLELITGRKPIDNGIDIVTWANPLIQNALEGRYANFIDPKLQSFDNEEVYRTVSCVNSCLNQPLNSRPTMEKIRFVLEGKLPPEKLCDDELQRSIRDPKGSRSSPELNRSIILGPRQYSYQQLAKATNYFSSNDLIGEGGFGQVYRGLLDGESFAIKKLKNHPDLQSQENLKNEIMVVSSIRHRNLIELLGYCIEGANRLLVFKYFPNKSLSSQLHESDLDLDWKTRINIAKGCAKGLEYLHEHCEPPILHLDIKSDNILLDDDFKPKVADFGLARFFSEAATHISESAIMGTKAYVDPYAIKTGQYSVKSDVYSFGVMLLELITGRRPIENGFDVVEWAKPKIKSALRNEEFEDFVDYTMHIFDHGEMYRMLFCIDVCINNRPKFRPSMKKIFLALEGLFSLDELFNEKGDNKLPWYPTYIKIQVRNRSISNKMWRSADEVLMRRSTEATNLLAEGVKRLGLSNDDEEEEDEEDEEEEEDDEEEVSDEEEEELEENEDGDNDLSHKSKMAEGGEVIACHTVRAWTEQLEKAQKGKQLTVVDFSAAWCPPCRYMSSVLAKMAKEMPNVTFLVVDVDELTSVTAEWKIEAMPTFLFFKQGKEVAKIVGANTEELQSTIAKHAVDDTPTIFTYQQIEWATRGFSKFLGEGSLGSVFKGFLDGKDVAVRKLEDLSDEEEQEELEQSIKTIGSVIHPNLVQQFGHCIEGSNIYLVLEFFPSNSLRSLLNGKKTLEWSKRMKIAIDSAKALEYLHDNYNIVHREIMTNNILVGKNFQPKVANFGLIMYYRSERTDVYADPEDNECSFEESDVYAFGVVLLELITGKNTKDNDTDIVQWANSLMKRALYGEYTLLIDSNLEGDYNKKEVQRMIYCAAACLYKPSDSRPQMKEDQEKEAAH